MIQIDPNIRPLVYTPDPRLRTMCAPVVRFGRTLQTLHERLHASMDAHGGVGLAAPQIGHTVRAIAIKTPDRRYTMVNPKIVTHGIGRIYAHEACLSIPGFVGLNIPRSRRVLVVGQDINGKTISVMASDHEARVLQHEIDHLDGILYIDYLKSPADLKRVA